MSFALEKPLPREGRWFFGGGWCHFHAWWSGHVPSLAPELRAVPPAVRAVRAQGPLPFCSQAQTLSKKFCKHITVWWQPLPVSERTRTIKPPPGRGCLSGPEQAWLGVAILQLKKTRGETEAQKLLRCHSSCGRYPRMTIPWRRAAAHHSVCSTGISWLGMTTCQWPQQSPWGDQLFSFSFVFFWGHSGMKPFLHSKLQQAWLGCWQEHPCMWQRPFAFPTTHPPGRNSHCEPGKRCTGCT